MEKARGALGPYQKTAGKRLRKRMRDSYMLYLFLLPSLAFIIIFHYAPMYGIQIAFKDFKSIQGIWGSKWVGLHHFKFFFESFRFGVLLTNTLTISIYSLLVGFPIPILLALIFNYVKSSKIKRLAQTISYAPHFISAVVLVGMMTMFFSPTTGFINTFRSMVGLESLHYFGVASYFPHLYVWSGVWQSAGWGAIIYIASLSGVDPQQHEAAIMDGAILPQRIWHIDLPALVPTIVVLLILNVGSLMSVGYEKVFLMQNPINLTTSEVISTYTYKIGLENAQFSYSAAIGLFNSVTNFILLVSVNHAARRISGSGLW